MESRKHGKLGLILEYISIALILIGFIAMVQPFTIRLFTAGFPIMLSGVILFNIGSHIK